LKAAEDKVREMNDPMENQGYMYELAADCISALRSPTGEGKS
jgi:hypothetical protein